VGVPPGGAGVGERVHFRLPGDGYLGISGALVLRQGQAVAADACLRGPGASPRLPHGLCCLWFLRHHAHQASTIYSDDDPEKVRRHTISSISICRK